MRGTDEKTQNHEFVSIRPCTIDRWLDYRDEYEQTQAAAMAVIHYDVVGHYVSTVAPLRHFCSNDPCTHNGL